MKSDNETVMLSPFVKGMNNIQKETNLPEGSLRDANNVDITDSGAIRRRPRITKVYDGVVDSLYKGMFAEDNKLKRFDGLNSATVLNANITSSKIAYCDTERGIYYTDGTHCFTPEHASAGLETPAGFYLYAIAGFMTKGEYVVTLAFEDTSTGEVSPTAKVESIVLNNDNMGISITNILQPSEFYNIRVYVSSADNQTLRLQSVLSMGTTSTNVVLYNSSGAPAQTLNTSPLPGGSHIVEFRGRLYVAKGNILYYSRPQHYGISSTSEDFYLFSEDISVCLSVEDGIYIVADKTYFIKGTSPEKTTLVTLSDKQAIPGTGESLDYSNFKSESSIRGKVAYWFSEDGAMLGLPGGVIEHVSKDRVAVPKGLSRGSTAFIAEDGIHKLITTMEQDVGDRREIKAQDSASAIIIRNGNIIQ